MAKRRTRRNGGFWSWAGEHPFLTFFLASSAVGGVVAVVTSFSSHPKDTSGQPVDPQLGP